MAHFAAKDTVADLMSDATDGPLRAPDTAKKHFPKRGAGDAMEGLLDGTGGPEEEHVTKKHFDLPADALEGGAVGMTTSDAKPFVPSIAMPDKPASHGDLTAQDIAPSDLSPTHMSTKRMFDDKPCGVESAPAEGAVAKRPRADLDGGRVKTALDATAPDSAPPAPPISKKQVDDVSNKRDRVLQGGDGSDATPVPFARKHFAKTGNECDSMGTVLNHPMSGPRAERPARPAPEPIAPSTAPIAGVASEGVNRVKKLQNVANAPVVGAGMSSASINKPFASHTAKAAPAAGAGASSSTIAKEHHGVSTTSGTAEAAKRAMGGADVSSALQWP